MREWIADHTRVNSNQTEVVASPAEARVTCLEFSPVLYPWANRPARSDNDEAGQFVGKLAGSAEPWRRKERSDDRSHGEGCLTPHTAPFPRLAVQLNATNPRSQSLLFQHLPRSSNPHLELC